MSATVTLAPDIVADDDLLAVAIDTWLVRDHAAACRQAEIDGLVGIFEEPLDPDLWALLRRTLDLVDARHDEIVIAAVRWAFAEGARTASADEGSR